MSEIIWDDSTRRWVDTYTKKPVARPKLEDIGTRFQHLADFQEYVAMGVDVVEKSLARHDNEADVNKKRGLEAAMVYLQAYQEQLANYDGLKWKLHEVLDSCPPDENIIEEIRSARIQKFKAEGKAEAAPEVTPKPMDDDYGEGGTASLDAPLD